MRNGTGDWIRRYGRTAAVVVALGILSVWPVLLVPLGNAYVTFCARFLSDTPFQHHYPPLLVGLVVSTVGALGVTFAWILLRQIVGQREIERTLATRRKAPDAEVLALFDRLNIAERVTLTHDSSVFVFCGGLIRPHIYLSNGLVDLLTSDEFEAVLLHERHHLLRHDPLRLFSSLLIRPFAVVFPVTSGIADWITIRVELAADRAVLRVVSVDVLASALVKVMRAMPVHNSPAAVAGLSPTDARVSALLGRPAEIAIDRRDVVVSLVVGCLLLTLVAWLATQSLPSPPRCFTCPAFSAS